MYPNPQPFSRWGFVSLRDEQLDQIRALIGTGGTPTNDKIMSIEMMFDLRDHLNLDKGLTSRASIRKAIVQKGIVETNQNLDTTKARFGTEELQQIINHLQNMKKEEKDEEEKSGKCRDPTGIEIARQTFKKVTAP